MKEKLKIVAKRMPRWCFVFLGLDFVLFLIMLSHDMSTCKSNVACFRLGTGMDRMADYLALMISIMAILIPLAIEVWREQFQSHKLAQKSALDKEYDTQFRGRYLNEPIGALVIFVALCFLAPLLVASSALFYAATFYGLYLLFYMFRMSFYKPPINIYDIPVLNPILKQPPDRDIMSELSSLTLEGSTSPNSPKQAQSDIRAWTSQLSDEKTLHLYCKWILSSLPVNKKQDIEKEYLWVIFTNYLTKCSASVIWLSVNEGELKAVFMSPHLYKDINLSRAGYLLKIVVERLSYNNEYDFEVKKLLQALPLSKIPDENFDLVLSSAITTLFDRETILNSTLSEAFPETWRVTSDTLKSNSIINRSVANIYIRWFIKQSNNKEINEEAVDNTTQFIFPEVEPFLFAKFVLLATNINKLSLEDKAPFINAVSRWHIFGHVGRVSAEWVPTQADEADFEARYAKSMKDGEDLTVEIVKRLGWLPYKKDVMYMLTTMVKTAVQQFAPEWSDARKQSWRNFADMLNQVAVDD